MGSKSTEKDLGDRKDNGSQRRHSLVARTYGGYGQMRFAVMSSMRWEDDSGLPGVPRATTGPLLAGKQAVPCSPAGVESHQALQKEPGCAASLTLAQETRLDF